MTFQPVKTNYIPLRRQTSNIRVREVRPPIWDQSDDRNRPFALDSDFMGRQFRAEGDTYAIPAPQLSEISFFY